MYAITRGKAMLSVDFKVSERKIEEVADFIHAHGSFDDLIFFANTGEEMAVAARAKQRYPEMIVMVRLLDTRVTVESTRAVFGGRLPDILHTDRIGATEVASLHDLGTKVYMNALPLDRYVEPFRYFAIRSLLETGPDFVLTGQPPVPDGQGRGATLRLNARDATPFGAGAAAMRPPSPPPRRPRRDAHCSPPRRPRSPPCGWTGP